MKFKKVLGKKITSLLICSSLVFSSAAIAFAVESYFVSGEKGRISDTTTSSGSIGDTTTTPDRIYGDIDGNGRLITADVSLVIASIAGEVKLTNEQIILTKVSGKDVLSLNDVSAILQKVLDSSFKFVVEEDTTTTESTTGKV